MTPQSQTPSSDGAAVDDNIASLISYTLAAVAGLIRLAPQTLNYPS